MKKEVHTTMRLSNILDFIMDAFKSLKRNKTISFAATMTVMITFFLFGIFLLLGFNLSNSIKDVASKIEIKVYMKDDIKNIEKRELEVALKEFPGVKQVIYETKEQAFVDLQDSLNDNQGLLEGYDIDNNPLPSAFIVRMDNAESINNIVNSVNSMPGVESIGNQQDVINSISTMVKVSEVLGIALFVLFIFVSLFLIVNTIKLTVFSRRREVGIMKFVGATNWFIRWPFIIEGIIIGATGTILSSIVLYLTYSWTYDWITETSYSLTLLEPVNICSVISCFFVIAGALIGVFGSSVALKKFLKV